MDYTGEITNFNFLPMVHVVPSTLNFDVLVKELNRKILFSESGTIEQLRKKFKFTVDKDNYDFTGFVGRECLVRRIDDTYQFIRLL